MTERLCSFLRASLSFDPTELVPLDEELALVEDYLEIEQVRFGDRLIVEVDCDEAARMVPIPGLLIQPLVENAIKYGVAPSRKPVTLAIAARVEADELLITVANDAAADADSVRAPGAGVGLKNIRDRLQALYGPAATLDAGPQPRGYAAHIRIPVDAAPAPARLAELAAS
jgi:LytS/YehU family sensor histidine kinase